MLYFVENALNIFIFDSAWQEPLDIDDPFHVNNCVLLWLSLVGTPQQK